MKKTIIKFLLVGVISGTLVINGCKSTLETDIVKETPHLMDKSSLAKTSGVCAQQTEQIDYTVYKMYADGARTGDAMPFYDVASSKFIIYNLKDVWNTTQRHPIYAFTTSNFYSFTETGQIIASNTDGCKQDYAIGTGSVIKNGSVYNFFYTGNNPNYPSACVTKKEGIMLATSTNPTAQFTKSTSFPTIYAPAGQGFDENDNFRDPYVYYDNGVYYMFISARKNVSGTWRGVIINYTSTNLTSWNYAGVVYDGGAINYFMMECSEVFKIGSTYYLTFSDTNTKNVYYRKSTSVTGPWSYPIGPDRFDGNGMYAARTASDGIDRYIFGWTAINSGNRDTGGPLWGGNLIPHKLYQKVNGDLAITIPHTLKANLEVNSHTIVKASQRGTVTVTIPGTQSYNVVSTSNLNISDVVFNPINLPRFKIKATVSYTTSAKDFGFMIGACDDVEDFYSLRFVPSQNRFSFDKLKRSLINTNTVATTDVPLTLSPNTSYNVQIVIENSMLIVYINDEVALSTRIYKATNTSWGIFSDNSNATFNNIIVNKP